MHVVEGESVGLLVPSQFVFEGRDFLIEGDVLQLEGVQVLCGGTKTSKLVKVQKVQPWY